jgi:molybdopterin synthase catalytic subunit
MTKNAVRLVDLREEPLDVAEVVAAVEDAAAGGVTLFVGTVRDSDQARAVRGLDYSAHPSALGQLRSVVAAVAARHPVTAVAAVHRVGGLAVGEVAVVVAAAAPHRGQAFDAARDLIDDLKATVPIWKHQVFADGQEEWVGAP